jgi:hypothetical protein
MELWDRIFGCLIDKQYRVKNLEFYLRDMFVMKSEFTSSTHIYFYAPLMEMNMDMDDVLNRRIYLSIMTDYFRNLLHQYFDEHSNYIFIYTHPTYFTIKEGVTKNLITVEGHIYKNAGTNQTDIKRGSGIS